MGRIAFATPDTTWHTDTTAIELGASPREKEDTAVSARAPARIARRPTTSLAPQRVGIAMS